MARDWETDIWVGVCTACLDSQQTGLGTIPSHISQGKVSRNLGGVSLTEFENSVYHHHPEESLRRETERGTEG